MVEFIIWRKKGYFNPFRTPEEQKKIKYALFMAAPRQKIYLRVNKKELQTDPQLLGKEVTKLVPILLPEAKQGIEMQDMEILSQRHVEPKEMLKSLDNLSISMQDVLELMPRNISFVPSKQVLVDLIQKMKEIESP